MLYDTGWEQTVTKKASRAVDDTGRLPALTDIDVPLAVHDRPLDVRTVITCAIDDIALAALRNHRAESVHCAICEDVIEGEVPSTGLMMWTRGDDIRYDEPPLCGPCASSISVSAWARWQLPPD
jgi:hypothetical protein